MIELAFLFLQQSSIRLAVAPVISNAGTAIAAVLIDPANGQPYKVGQSDTTTSLPIPNVSAPNGVALVNPTTGVAYHP